MATSSTTSSTTSPTAPQSSTPTFSPASLFNNLNHCVTTQLTRDNYITWQWQMIIYLKAHNVYGFVEGTVLPPPQTIANPTPLEGSAAMVANPAFLKWLHQDQMVLSTIVSTISGNLISQVIDYSTYCEVWNALERMYSS